MYTYLFGYSTNCSAATRYHGSSIAQHVLTTFISMQMWENTIFCLLSYWQDFVSLNNISSNLNDINCGIPQGSVLGPLLFLLYINDFYKCSEIFDFHHFADDSNLFYENENLLDLESNINRELANIQVVP